MTGRERLRTTAAFAYLLAVVAVILVLVVAGVLIGHVPGTRRIERAVESLLGLVLDALLAPFDALGPPG